MKNLSKFETFKLNKEQMNAIAGGTVSAKEYCDKLYATAINKELSEGEKQGLNAGWIAADCDQFDYNGFSVS